MDENFSAEFFAGNRAHLRELFTGKAPIVITANGLLQRGGDSPFPFQQDASFWYLTGIDEPDVILVMDKDKEYLIMPKVSDFHDIFDGSIDTDSLAKQSGITTILNTKDGWKQLSSSLKKVKHVATLSANPDYVEAYGIYVNPARGALTKKIKAINPSVKLLDLRQHLAKLRMVKQPLELKAIKQAVKLTSDAIRRVKTKLPRLEYEFEVEAEITSYFLRHGSRNAWRPIVASGPNACTIHARNNISKLTKAGVIVIDIGAEVSHYCADITRTLSVDNQPNRRAQAILAAALEVHKFALSLQKPGSLVKDNEKLVEEFMGENLRELSLIKTIDHESVRKYFPHATSHFLGLDPHDAGDYNQPLEVGTVLTVEPGIYVPEEGIGVRIEDDVVITVTGQENLSGRLPYKL